MSDRFDILSLSGGGFLGLYTIAVIAGLEEIAGKPIARCFDLMAGTSIGGIIALGLAAEIPAADIQRAFQEKGPSVVSGRPAPATALATLWDLRRCFLKPKYTTDALRRTIVEFVGEATSMGDLKHRVIVPAVNLTEGHLRVFRTPHHPDFSADRHLKVVDVALATAAAPIFFPLAEIGNALYGDGGLYAYSPALVATHEAEYFLGQAKESISLLSIGTATAHYSSRHALGSHLGLIGWWREQNLPNVVIAAQQDLVDYITAQDLDGRYLRLDVDQSRRPSHQLALDVATPDAQKTILGLAHATLQANINDERLTAFLAHRAPAPTFYHETVSRKTRTDGNATSERAAVS
jgi:patatin-like phospholipase/acyl hydrolase